LLALPNVVLHDRLARWQGIIEHAAGILTIAAVAWAVVAMITLWGDILLARYRMDVADNLLARQMETRVDILARSAVIVVTILAIAIVLMTFPPIRALGTGLLASAGAAGLIVGIAARPLFENLFAGIQLAFTEPIRLDDVVVVNGEWGKIEEIRSTYVIIQLWDMRRMVVPLAWFLTNPFENWTRRTADILGEVKIVYDLSLDVEALRAEVPKILGRSQLWDGRVQSVQVTDVSNSAITVRILVSARNSNDLWDLRCYLREAVLGFLREPKSKASWAPGPDGKERKGAEEVQRVRTVQDEPRK
jgi:small-conductance mechanosensitive channel